jgi:thiol-disulfide isomerase/thioredoxin
MSMWWLAVPLAVLILALVALRPGRNPSLQDSPAIGKPTPRLDLVRLIDEPPGDRLDGVSRGEVALIHFWGTWCGPCKMEYPELSAMAARLQSDPRFLFVSVSCEGGRGETFNDLRKKTSDYFLSEGIDGPAFADPQGITRGSTAERLERGWMSYPTSLVIGPDGQIAGVWEGYAPGAVDQMESLIERLLDDSAVQI